MQRAKVLTIYAFVASVAVVTTVIALLMTQRTIPGTGTIQTVGVGAYWDPLCTNATTSINFGLLTPGSSKSYTLYLKNEGNSDIIVSMTPQNWNPTLASDYITLTWDREGQKLTPGQSVGFVLSISISADAQGFSTFNVDIVISGTG